MGFVLSKFRRKKKTLDILEEIEKEINRITASKRQNVASQNQLLKIILTYGVVFWLLAMGIIYYLYRTAQRTDDYILLTPLLILIPTLLIVFRRMLSWWYHRKIIKDEDKLVKMKEQKAKILDEVMEKETFKVATEILKKFDPSKLGTKPTTGPSVAPAPGRQLTAVRPLSAGTGMDLRKRQLQQGPGPNLNSSLSIPPKPNQGPQPAANLNRTIASVPSSSSSTATNAAPPPPLGRPGGGRAGPPLPRPILPRERGYMDKFVEYLVGDGPSNRYALICRQCQSHNGMALREEFEYVSYRCCYCHYWNPARKQRPVAPRLPDPSTVKPLDSDSSDESSKSGKNSAANSRRSSLGGPEGVRGTDSVKQPPSQQSSDPETDSPPVDETKPELQEPEPRDTEPLLSEPHGTESAESEKSEESNTESEHIELMNKEYTGDKSAEGMES